MIEKSEMAELILNEFGLEGDDVHIINGHVPVHQKKEESPVKAGGKVLIIDGGFSKAYHKETGIASYMLIYNSYGLTLIVHEPFESSEIAIQEEADIVSRQVAVEYSMKRQLVRDTDNGKKLQIRIYLSLKNNEYNVPSSQKSEPPWLFIMKPMKLCQIP